MIAPASRSTRSCFWSDHLQLRAKHVLGERGSYVVCIHALVLVRFSPYQGAMQIDPAGAFDTGGDL